MDAPDKIYMPNELLSEEWQRHIEGEDTCYIRKDALLEWANWYKEEINKESNSEGFAARAAKSILNDLTDKLNSL